MASFAVFFFVGSNMRTAMIDRKIQNNHLSSVPENKSILRLPRPTPIRLAGTTILTIDQSTLPSLLWENTEETDPTDTTAIDVARATRGACSGSKPNIGKAMIKSGTVIRAMPTPIRPSSKPPAKPATKKMPRDNAIVMVQKSRREAQGMHERLRDRYSSGRAVPGNPVHIGIDVSIW